MTLETKKPQEEEQKPDLQIVNEMALNSMIGVPFENFSRIITNGDSSNLEIAAINSEAKAEFDNFLDELNQELQTAENLERIKTTVERAIEKRKRLAATAIAESTPGIKPGSPEAAGEAARQMAAWEARAAQLEQRKKKAH